MHFAPEALFFLQSLIIIGVPFVIWRFKPIQKFAPLVVIQILLGIALGPTILGKLAPDLLNILYPAASLSVLNGLSWLGVVLFGFLAGLHFDLRSITHKSKAFVASGLSSLIIPVLMGAVLAIVFSQPEYRGAGTPEWLYILGISTAIGVTALPVLNAILIETKLIHTPVGQRTLGYAVMNDLLLWIAIAVIGYATTDSERLVENGTLSFIAMVFLVIAFLVLMKTVMKPLLEWLTRRHKLTDNPSSKEHAFIIALVIFCGLVTELIGIHYLFGAFILGTMMPRTISHGFYRSLEKFTILILLPYFFILTGLKTSLSIDDSAAWILFICATLVAVISKVIGTFIPERLFIQSSTSEALQAGSLMQTKGLMEIVVLNLLLTAGVINTTVFSALVLMAVATTVLTKPSLALIQRFSKG